MEYNEEKFCLCVDDIGIKYFSDTDADHLMKTVLKNYKTSMDLEEKIYCESTAY